MNLAGRTTLLTGATGGLGHAIARALAQRGARLVLTGRRQEVLEPLAAELGARAVGADLADSRAVEALLAEAGDVEVLVANAGVPADGPVLEYTAEQIDRALDVNLRAPIHLARALIEPMTARGEGHMLFMSSLSGKVATHHSALYSATKYGLRGFASAMRQDLADTGIGVSAVFPGPIRDAGMFADSGARMPLGAGTRSPQDVGRAVVRAIERDRSEIDVASVPARVWTILGGIAPGTLTALNRRLGAEQIAAQIAGSEAHRSKR